MAILHQPGAAAVYACNEALLAKAAEAKLLRTRRLRAATTVVPVDVAYPTDSGLLANWPRQCVGSPPPSDGCRRRAVRPGPGFESAAGPRGRGGQEIGAKLRLRAAQPRDE